MNILNYFLVNELVVSMSSYNMTRYYYYYLNKLKYYIFAFLYATFGICGRYTNSLIMLSERIMLFSIATRS